MLINSLFLDNVDKNISELQRIYCDNITHSDHQKAHEFARATIEISNLQIRLEKCERTIKKLRKQLKEKK